MTEHRPLSPKVLSDKGAVLAALRGSPHRRVFVIRLKSEAWTHFVGEDGHIVLAEDSAIKNLARAKMLDHDPDHPLDSENAVVFKLVDQPVIK